MASVADGLRRDTVERVRRLAPLARVALALSLGDDDLRLFMRATGKPRDEARRVLRAQRARGRIASRSAIG